MDAPRRHGPRPALTWGAVGLALLLLVPASALGQSPPGAQPTVTASVPSGPRAVGPLPYSVGLGYDGPNVTGVAVVVVNITIPTGTSPDFLGNFTLGLQIADTACTVTTSAIDVENNTFEFTDIFAPSSGSPRQGWAKTALTDGDTYQLVVNISSGILTSEIFDVTTGGYFHPGGDPLAEASYADPTATALVLGPAPCDGTLHPWATNLTMIYSPASPYTPALDYLFQKEAFGTSADTTQTLAPNLWRPFRHNAPADIALDQAWATSAILSEVTGPSAVTFSVKKAPPTSVDEGDNFSLSVLGTTDSTDTNEVFASHTVIEMTGTPDTVSNSFLTCTSENGTVQTWLNGTSGFGGEYGYTTNTTPSDLTWSSMGTPPSGTTLDLECTTSDLAYTGTITIYALAYDEYFSTSPEPTYIDALASGARDLFGMSAWSAQVQVNPQLLIQATATPSVVVPHETVWANASELGGTSPVSTSWYINGSLQSCTTLDCQFSWTTPGVYGVWAAASDPTGARVVTLHQNITVEPTPSASITPAPTGVGSVGEPVLLHATAAGGTDGYTYAFWTNASGASPVQKGPDAFANVTFAHPATYTAWVVVNDSHGDVARSANSTITVYAAMALGLSPLSATTEVGIPGTTFTSNVTGAVGTVLVSWHTSGLATGPSCAVTCIVDPSLNGTFQIWYDASDATGRVVASTHANLTVLPQVHFASWTASSEGDEGGNATVTVHFTGGRAPYLYAWRVNSQLTGTCASSATCSITLPSGTVAMVTVAVTDALGANTTAPAWSIDEVPPLQVTLGPSPTATAEAGVPLTLTATATQGTGGDHYAFYRGPSPLVLLGAGANATGAWALPTAGTVQVWAVVNDSSGYQVASAHTNVTVLPALKVLVTPSTPGPISLGASLALEATTTGGQGPVTFCWSVDGSPGGSCPMPSSFNDTPSAVGRGNVTVTVSDALGGRAVSAPVNVTVVAARDGSVTLIVAPGEGGSVLLSGTVVATGSIHSVLLGSYALSAVAAPGFAFTGWQSSDTAALILTSDLSASTELTVGGNGTITASFVGITPLAVEVGIDPAGSGSVILNGSEVAGTSNLSLRAGIYDLLDVPDSDVSFSGWTTTGGVAVISGATSTELNVSAAGTVTAHFGGATHPTEDEVVFQVSPSGTDVGFVFQGTTYAAGATVGTTAGSYALSISLPSGVTFKSWVVSGAGTVVASSTSPSTTLSVAGNATVTAEVSVASSGSVVAGLSTTDLGILGALAVALIVVVAVGLHRRRTNEEARAEAYTAKRREGGSS